MFCQLFFIDEIEKRRKEISYKCYSTKEAKNSGATNQPK